MLLGLLARDPAILRGKVPARTIDTILDGVVALQPLMPGISVPLLILHGGADVVTPPEGESFSLADVYADPKNRILLLSTSAGWCTAWARKG